MSNYNEKRNLISFLAIYKVQTKIVDQSHQNEENSPFLLSFGLTCEAIANLSKHPHEGDVVMYKNGLKGEFNTMQIGAVLTSYVNETINNSTAVEMLLNWNDEELYRQQFGDRVLEWFPQPVIEETVEVAEEEIISFGNSFEYDGEIVRLSIVKNNGDRFEVLLDRDDLPRIIDKFTSLCTVMNGSKSRQHIAGNIRDKGVHKVISVGRFILGLEKGQYVGFLNGNSFDLRKDNMFTKTTANLSVNAIAPSKRKIVEVDGRKISVRQK